MLKRRTRHAQRGQTLVMALGFMALFGLLAAAVLRFASVTEAQRVATEQSAAAKALAEGSAQFALADTGLQPCGSTTGGTLTFPAAGGSGSDTLTYQSPQGSCVGIPAGDAPGRDCLLCILDSGGGYTEAPISVHGEIDTDSSITGSGSVTATGGIGLYDNASCAKCSPIRTTSGSPYTDPLANTPVPTQHGTIQAPAVCDPQPHAPGTYVSITADNCTVTLQPGLYVVTGSISVTGASGLLQGNGVVIYLACPTRNHLDWTTCAEGQSGGSLFVGSKGQLSLKAPSANKADPYYGMSLFSDVRLDGALMDVEGGGGSLDGTVYLVDGELSLSQSDSTAPPTSLSIGRLDSEELSVSGSKTQLSLTGSVLPQCSYYTDTVTGQGSSGGSHVARVGFVSNCSSGAGSLDSIVEFTFAGP